MTQIDGLRCLAFASVAWSHWAPDRWQIGLPWGTGVQLFFVISGFLITGILLDNRRGDILVNVWRRFYARRALRIFPLFYMMIAVGLILNIQPIRSTWPWQASYLANFHYALQGRFAGDHFAHFWSLAVEEQFYLVWPFLVLLLSLGRLETILWGFIILAPLSRIASSFVIKPDVVHTLTWSNLDSLGIGSLFACLARYPESQKWNARQLANFCLWVGLPLGGLGGLLASKWDLPFAALTISHTGLILFYGWAVFGAAQGFKGVAGKILTNQLIVYLGKISYGLYVFHMFAPLFVAYLGTHIKFFASLVSSDAWGLVLDALVTLTVAMVSWHCFEKPLNDLKRFIPYVPDRSIRPAVVGTPAQADIAVNE
jgi:peptidoglycan/LPS O-acetylase OafA/YrhL